MHSSDESAAVETSADETTAKPAWTMRKVLIAIAGTVILTAGAGVMLFVAIVTLFQTRRFCSEVIAKKMAELALWLCNVRIVEHRQQPLPTCQTVYLSNHTATLDIFVITALGLPRARYFLSGFLRKILPFGLIGYLIGVFWTVPYKYPEKRRAIFQHADRILRQTGDSVYLSPEGGRIYTGEIGHFNRGAFHLATSLRADIVPIYVHIPEAADAGMNLVSGCGIVDVYFLPTISANDWTVEDLDKNRDRVRDIYVEFNRKLKSDHSNKNS